MRGFNSVIGIHVPRVVRHDHTMDSRAYLMHKERLFNRILSKFPEVNEQAQVEGFRVGAATTMV